MYMHVHVELWLELFRRNIYIYEYYEKNIIFIFFFSRVFILLDLLAHYYSLLTSGFILNNGELTIEYVCTYYI